MGMRRFVFHRRRGFEPLERYLRFPRQDLPEFLISAA